MTTRSRDTSVWFVVGHAGYWVVSSSTSGRGLGKRTLSDVLWQAFRRNSAPGNRLVVTSVLMRKRSQSCAPTIIFAQLRSAGRAHGLLLRRLLRYTAKRRDVSQPLNCLPGSGWTMTDPATVKTHAGIRRLFDANRYIIKNGDTRQVLVLVSGRGRVVASEYWGRFTP